VLEGSRIDLVDDSPLPPQVPTRSALLVHFVVHVSSPSLRSLSGSEALSFGRSAGRRGCSTTAALPGIRHPFSVSTSAAPAPPYATCSLDQSRPHAPSGGGPSNGSGAGSKFMSRPRLRKSSRSPASPPKKRSTIASEPSTAPSTPRG